MILRIFTLLAAYSYSALSINAQVTNSLRAEIRMLSFSPDLALSVAFAQDPAAQDSVSIPSPIKNYLNHEFSTVEFKSRKIAFTKKPDKASLTREGELIGEVTLPEGVSSAILLFLPGNPGAKAACQILSIDDSKRAFPVGSYSATNLSPLPVRLVLEGKNYDFKAGQHVVIENPPTREGGMIGMRAFAFEKGGWNPIGAQLWPSPGQSRNVLVMFLNPESKTVQLRGYDDVPPRTAKAEVQSDP